MTGRLPHGKGTCEARWVMRKVHGDVDDDETDRLGVAIVETKPDVEKASDKHEQNSVAV